jgi:maleylacetoacetate isomerase
MGNKHMKLKLYGYWRSSASYRVRIALHLKQLKYESIPVHLVNNGGEQTSEAYKYLNPAMLVPTFTDEDENCTLNQSLAIIEFLDEKYPGVAPLLPRNAVDKARVRTIAQDIACDIQPVSNLRVLNKLKSNFQADNKAVSQWSHDVIQTGLAAIEKRLVASAGKFAFGDTVSLADICVVPQVYNALRFGVNMEQFPHIYKTYQHCQTLAEFIKAAPENQLDAP